MFGADFLSDEVNHEIALEDRKREEKMKQMVAEKNLQLQVSSTLRRSSTVYR